MKRENRNLGTKEEKYIVVRWPNLTTLNTTDTRLPQAVTTPKICDKAEDHHKYYVAEKSHFFLMKSIFLKVSIQKMLPKLLENPSYRLKVALA